MTSKLDGLAADEPHARSAQRRARSLPEGPPRWKRWLKRLVVAALVALALLCIAIAGLYWWLEDDILPVFDQAKAARLSPKVRHEYDVQLFNQMTIRGELPLEPRYLLFRKMADDGFEMAYIALQLYDIRYSDLPRKPPIRTALPRLKQLAQAGDASAQCFYARFGVGFEEPSERYNQLADTYAKAAAEQGHPACSATYALSFASSEAEKIDWLKKSAELGHANAQSMLASAYLDGEGVPQDFGLAYCWANEAVTRTGSIRVGNYISTIYHFEDKARRAGQAVVVKRYRPGTNCSEVLD